MTPADLLTTQEAAALIGQQRRLRWPRRRGPSTLWITVTIEDVVQSYGSRWDAIVRPSVPGLGSGSVRVWLSKLGPGP